MANNIYHLEQTLINPLKLKIFNKISNKNSLEIIWAKKNKDMKEDNKKFIYYHIKHSNQKLNIIYYNKTNINYNK